MSLGWPVQLAAGRVGLRPFRLRDAPAWVEVRLRNEAWLSPWEGRPADAPALTWAERHTLGAFSAMLRAQRRDARAGRALPFAVTYDGALAGQVTVGNVVRGAYDGAYVGYWVDQRVAGRGVTPTALALALRHAFGEVGLHRVEANVRPENAASLRVVEKLGFRDEGVHRRYLFIDGDWRDHRAFALLREDVADGSLGRLLRAAGS
jgi:ribosomal-protein-alanine N-acetyltransferase